MLFNFALDCVNRKVEENQVGVKLNGTHQLLGYVNDVRLKLNWTRQLLIYADEVNLLGDNIYTINTNTETLTDASKEVVPAVRAEKTKYRRMCMLLSRHQNAGQNRDIKIANGSFENVAQLRYFETTSKSKFDS
jgi:hypothetical protein